MKYLKLPNRTELHVWTPLLAARGDMIEVSDEPQPNVQPPLGLVVPAIAAESPKLVLAAYTLKSAGFGRYNVLDAEGVSVTAALPKAEAQAKLAELNA